MEDKMTTFDDITNTLWKNIPRSYRCGKLQGFYPFHVVH